MTDSKPSFIGNSTPLDAFIHEYAKSFRSYSANKIKVTMTREQYAAIKETINVLSNESHAMASGVEAVGYLLARLDYRDRSLEGSQLENVGYLLSLLGKNLGSHHHLIECLKNDLRRAQKDISVQ